MNAVEIIQEIERLPENEKEKEKVIDFMRHLPNEETLAAMEEAKHPETLEKFNSAEDMFKRRHFDFGAHGFAQRTVPQSSLDKL